MPSTDAAVPEDDAAGLRGGRPHLRHDPLFDRTVFVAPERAGRPSDLEGDSLRCPFCAGNESATPPEILRSPAAAAGPWRARIVPNRFPFVAPPPASSATAGRPDPRPPAAGVHDLVIESPDHVSSILDIPPEDWRDSWELCRRRLEQLSRRDDIAWATVFKNSGIKAGASLEHVHSQLVGLGFVPPTIAAELAAARGQRDAFGQVIDRAAAERRIVAEADGLVALVPPAPRQPFEAWIVPRMPGAFFHATGAAQVEALAALTRSFVGRLERLVPGADYNWWLHEPPSPRWLAARGEAGMAADWRWHLEIMPRIHGLAGFELGAGCHVTTVGPEDSARMLREAAEAAFPDGPAHFPVGRAETIRPSRGQRRG